MRNLQTFLADYGESHQNPVNQWVHILCVPAIFVSTLGLFWLLPLGQWLGLEGAWAYWVNGGTLLAAICMPFYFRMSLGMTVLMAGWLAVSLAIIGPGRCRYGATRWRARNPPLWMIWCFFWSAPCLSASSWHTSWALAVAYRPDRPLPARGRAGMIGGYE